MPDAIVPLTADQASMVTRYLTPLPGDPPLYRCMGNAHKSDRGQFNQLDVRIEFGYPRATEQCTSVELHEMGMVGLYKRVNPGDLEAHEIPRVPLTDNLLVPPPAVIPDELRFTKQDMDRVNAGIKEACAILRQRGGDPEFVAGYVAEQRAREEAQFNRPDSPATEAP